MSDKKYYTPELSELHEGFELELRDPTINPDTWQPIVIGENFDLPVIRHLFKSGQQATYIRVKHLDHDDIVAEGWVLDGDDFIKSIDSILFSLEKRSNKQGYMLGCYGEHKWMQVRNRSELRLIMKILGISNEAKI